ncbi:ubiquitin carboxyl-terminal hydrolase 32-like isoform X2 [Watersipora subatra]|uniref:ubiquitin carboxyl-terminal hydrolase 32-like isoform X2 n=1 Tax=Watersipora subatra TaxID=2589382 RepID=UPI00355C0F31
MGNKEVKPVTVSYDDAVKRVTAGELSRLKETFRRVCPGNSMSLNVFMREVLGEGVPHVIAEQVFYAFGARSDKNLSFKELVCGLVLFTRARDSNDERIKFLFGLYADDDLRIRKEVIDAVILKTDGHIPEPLSELFEHKDEVDYLTFKRWLLHYPEFSCLSYWLILEPCSSTLTAANDMPSFYQTLSGVTHLNESEIAYLEGNYNRLRTMSGTGRFDVDLFRRLVSPPLPRQLTGSLYKAFDENQDGHIDFKEMVCGLSACCKGPEVERHKFCFKVFDMDQDGYLSKAELIGAIEASFTVLQQNENAENQSLSSGSSTMADLLEMDAYTMAGEILATHGNAKEGTLSQAEFLVWAVQSKVPQSFSELLFEVSHVILGMKPATREDEGRVVKGWLSRELKRGYSLGQTWYLVASTWWRRWLNYVSECQVTEVPDFSSTLEYSSNSFDSPDRRYSHQMNGDIQSHQPRPVRPGPIDNSHLVINSHSRLPRWTNEGGTLRAYIEYGKDYQLVPELLWSALHSWYQGDIQLPRPVIIHEEDGSKTPEVELYSLNVKLYRHQASYQAPQHPMTTVAGVTGGIANFAMSMTGLQNSLPKRVHISNAAFSHQHSLKQITDFLAQRLKVARDDLRLWKYHHDNDLELLEGDQKLLEELGVKDGQSILMEVLNPDLTWPEEMLEILKRNTKKQVEVEKGTTGLSNLGNTCFMNSAIQCVSNCKPLTVYFQRNLHLYELNRANPLGMKGRLAQLYAKLINGLWDGTNKNLPPVELRYTLAKYAPQFTGCQQHDAQELLSFLLDGLHEDLNRVQKKPYVELKDSDGRPDDVLAKEGWDYHLSRNRSIIVDLFHGQLKSIVRCQTCHHSSIRFDPFTYLSLPLPMENSLLLEIIVICKDGSVPVRYGVRLNSDDHYCEVRAPLSKLTNIAPELFLFVELYGAYVKSFPLDSQKIKQRIGSGQPLYAYEQQTAIPRQQSSKTSEDTKGLKQNGEVSSHTEVTATEQISHKSGINSPAINGLGTFKSSDESGRTSGYSTLTRPSQNGSTAIPTSNQSTANSLPGNNIDSIQSEATKPDGLVVAMHRKMERQSHYFLAPQQSVPCMFGTPVILETTSSTTNKDLYHDVWTMIKRFVTGHPVTESCNHAQDCDGSLGNEYPFQLLMTKRSGNTCSRCPFYKFCRGCLIDYTEDLFNSETDYLVIDWDFTAYYLRYQASPDTVHSSVSEVYNLDDPLDIQQCLKAFTKEEQLAEDELYFCSKCKEHRRATKKLELWRLPNILIIHLKRFQFLSNRWVKSQKLVDFPIKDFDPESYLVQRSAPEEACKSTGTSLNSGPMGDHSEELDPGNSTNSLGLPTRAKTQSVTSCDSLDYSQAKYDLHAVSCHRGNLGGGHYITCTKNPNGKWYEYNDSMVKELSEATVTQANQRNCYILFYERQDLIYEKLMPNISGRQRDDSGIDEEFNTELSKAASCVIQ